jgi:hypothetical protein
MSLFTLASQLFLTYLEILPSTYPIRQLLGYISFSSVGDVLSVAAAWNFFPVCSFTEFNSLD